MTAAAAAPVLRDGTPEEAGLLAGHLARAVTEVEAAAGGRPPAFPGAVVLVARGGVVALHRAVGWAVRHAGGSGGELPRDRWVATRPDTVFDVASISKLFTAVVAAREVEHGRLHPDEPVAAHLPEFAAGGKDRITLRHLLTHTSGLRPYLPLWSDHATPAKRLAAVCAVVPDAPPGTRYAYSDLNMIAAGALVERAAGAPLDALVREGVTGPLGMRDTGYRPPATLRPRIAATEYQRDTGRGLVWGEVHDENAWALRGVAGHAGVFSTARDLAVLGQALLGGGAYGTARVLSRRSVDLLLADANAAFPGHAHGLGLELDQPWYMGALATPRTAGHTGFTGTSLVLDPASGTLVVLLTNRVHPRRDGPPVNPVRVAVADAVARALPAAARR